MPRLFWIAMCCFATLLIPYLTSLIAYLMFSIALSEEVIYTKTLSGYEFFLFFLGIVFFAFYVAFKKGIELKQENDLTI